MFKRINLFITTLIFLATSIVYIFYPKISLSSDILGNWLSTTSMPTTSNTGSHYSFVYNDKLYSIGGANTSTFPNGLYSEIALNGTISNWTNINSQPNILWHSGTTYDNYIYILGGANSSVVNINDVKVGIIDSEGNITSWSSTTPLPFSLSLGAAVTVGNRVYFAGGSTSEENSSNAKSEIWKSDINPTDGTLGAWTLAGNLPQPMLGFGMVEHNGYLIILGGKTTGNVYLSDVKKAQVDSTTGNIGTWSSLPSLPDPVYRAGVTKADNLIVSAGGYHVSPSFTLMDKVNFAEVNLSGDIAGWTESGFKLPQPTCCFSLSSWNKFIYMVGGWVGSYVNNVYMSKIESSATPTVTPTATPTATATSTPSPSPSPTIAPSPTPIISILNVPSLKQYSMPWGNKIYDHTKNTIHEFGCALTSATMVLQYHGHNIMPDILNNWLKSQPDGYLGNGLINWLAVSRYTKLNDSLTSPTLEYKRLPSTESNLDNELNNNRPVILKEPGHFVVATGKLTDTYTINDPGYPARNNLIPYNNSYLAINSYRPTHSDLSYMMFTVDGNVTLEILDSNNNIVPTLSFIEDPISNINNQEDVSGNPQSVLLFEKPNSGNYQLRVTNSIGKYSLNTYLYNADGIVTQNNFTGILMGGDTDIYHINYSPTGSVKLSINEILDNLDLAKNNKLIKNKGIYQYIKVQLGLYERLSSERIIKLLIKQIRIFTPRFIDPIYSLVLRQNLKTLID